MRLIYTLSVWIYTAAITIVSPFNSKAKKWLVGRKRLLAKIKSDLKKHKIKPKEAIWIHCASLGEFEQGRPLIEKIKEVEPSSIIILTFFSPSGFEIRRNYPQADFVYYLPADTPNNAKEFIRIIRPKQVYFVKYEFWFNYLNELKFNNINTYLVSGIFRKKQHFFKWYGGWFKEQLSAFTQFFVQHESDKALLNSIGYKNVTVSGDTRFDRVKSIASSIKPIPLIESFMKSKKLMVAGSTWKEDDNLIAQLDLTKEGFKLVVAPHEVNASRIQELFAVYKNKRCIEMSKANEENVNEYDVLIIDSYGLLSSIYNYGSVAYIGGGFGAGIHNTLEAATFGLPTVFGPNYHKFSEAIELINLRGAYSIKNAEELKRKIGELLKEDNLSAASQLSKNFVNNNTGATSSILSHTISL